MIRYLYIGQPYFIRIYFDEIIYDKDSNDTYLYLNHELVTKLKGQLTLEYEIPIKSPVQKFSYQRI